MGQVSGSEAEVWFKIETTNGVLNSDDSGASTTLAAAVNPGATSITVASDTSIAAGDVLKVGNAKNAEYVVVDSAYVSGTTVALESTTKINFRHESGEAVVETDPTNDWVKLGNTRAFDPQGGRSAQRSQAVSGTRVVSNQRLGNYDASINWDVELGIEGVGFALAHLLNNAWKTVGTATAGASTTLAAAASIGDTSITVASETGIAAGEFLQIESGDNAETIKVDAGYTTGTSIDIDTVTHPNGLRQAHANASSVDEVISPFTHTIKRGNNLPAGISFLLRYSGEEELGLYTGVKLGQGDLIITPGDLPTLSISGEGKKVQTLSQNIFGTHTALSHTPYSHTECAIEIDDAALTSNEFKSATISIQNTLQANNVIGSPFKGAITEGEGALTLSISSQFEDSTFTDKIVADTETKVEFNFTYTSDSNHYLYVEIPKTRFEGTPLPGFSSKDPVTIDLQATGVADSTQGNTDVVVTVLTPNHNLEYPE